MHDNPEVHVSSAKQLIELNEKREKETLRERAVANKATQLASELVVLQKESHELAKKALNEANHRREQERALHETNGTDVVDLRPNFYGIGFNLNEVWRRIKKWCSK